MTSIDTDAKGICTLHFDDGKANAVDPAWLEWLEKGLDQASNAKVLVLRGRPGYFSAGLNLKVIPTLDAEEFKQFSYQYADLLLRLLSLPIPTIAAVEGHAMAAGAVTLLACDYRVGTRCNAKIGLNETQIGLPLPTFCIDIASSKIPRTSWQETIVEGNTFDPEQALRTGYLSKLCEPEDLEQELEKLSGFVRNLANDAFATTKTRLYADIVARGSLSARKEFDQARA